MKKYILSASLGITIGTVISIITSSLFGKGTYLPLNPFSTMGSYYLEHFNQPIVMLICVSIWGLIGILFQAADRIFQQDWSLLKMSVAHFFVTSFCYTPLAILAGWFRVKLSSLLFFWVLFMMIYALIFVINYRKMEGSIQDINSRL